MTLLATLKQDQLAFRKARETEKATLLTTLIGEAAMIGKNDGDRETTDAEVIKVIQKFIKNIDDTVTALNKLSPVPTEKVLHAQSERVVLERYLPTQLTEVQLKTAITQIIAASSATTPKDVGRVMKALKDQYDGQYDGQLASTIVRSILK